MALYTTKVLAGRHYCANPLLPALFLTRLPTLLSLLPNRLPGPEPHRGGCGGAARRRLQPSGRQAGRGPVPQVSVSCADGCQQRGGGGG